MVERSRTFGEVAEVYDRVRAGYPPLLVADVCSYLGCPAPDVIEVGAGTGKATVAFADQAGSLLAVEPDAAMASFLRRNTAPWPAVQVIGSAFEALRPSRRRDVIVSGDAWHWIDADRRWPLAIEHLRPGGVIAIFSNFVILTRQEQRTAFAAALAPNPHRGSHLDLPAGPIAEVWPGPEIAAHPALCDHTCREYQQDRVFSVADFVAQLSTQSVFRILGEGERGRLFANVGDRLAAVSHDVPLTVHTQLHLARVGTNAEGCQRGR